MRIVLVRICQTEKTGAGEIDVLAQLPDFGDTPLSLEFGNANNSLS